MDYRIYDPIVYPVFILANTGEIIHANPAGLFWLSKAMNNMLTGTIGDHVSFSGIDIAAIVRDAEPYQRLPYRTLAFRLYHRNIDGYCDVAAMKLSGDDREFNYALFVYDKKTIEESEVIAHQEVAVSQPTGAMAAQSAVTPEGLNLATAPAAPTETVPTGSGLFKLDLMAEKQARLNSKVNVMCPELHLQAIGQTVSISNDWLEFVVKKTGFKPGYACSIEISDLGGLSGFMSKCKILFVTENGADELVRVQFDGISSVNKRNLDEYMAKNAK